MQIQSILPININNNKIAFQGKVNPSVDKYIQDSIVREQRELLSEGNVQPERLQFISDAWNKILIRFHEYLGAMHSDTELTIENEVNNDEIVRKNLILRNSKLNVTAHMLFPDTLYDKNRTNPYQHRIILEEVSNYITPNVGDSAIFHRASYELLKRVSSQNDISGEQARAILAFENETHCIE